MPSPRQQEGTDKEWEASDWLTSQGLRQLAHQVRYPFGEIDLIMVDGAVIVFVEVRMRASLSFGGALASVTLTKRRRILRAARAWLAARGGPAPACRFDLMAHEAGQWCWIQNAFDETAR
ncbi:MAG TPA: YraN family protein [Burkholderiaceae bacterium]|jgi:putative endonuclease|nr:YraN family protein [Burkholderiaceae bacterium]